MKITFGAYRMSIIFICKYPYLQSKLLTILFCQSSKIAYLDEFEKSKELRLQEGFEDGYVKTLHPATLIGRELGVVSIKATLEKMCGKSYEERVLNYCTIFSSDTISIYSLILSLTNYFQVLLVNHFLRKELQPFNWLHKLGSIFVMGGVMFRLRHLYKMMANVKQNRGLLFSSIIYTLVPSSKTR